MNISAFFRPAALTAILVHSVFADPLDAYRGVNRLIVVSFPQGALAEKVAAALVTHGGAIDERDLKIIDASEANHRVPTALRLPPEQTVSLRKQLKMIVGEARTVFILLGKDGNEKARQYGTLDLVKWFALIDEMPMRRQEVKNQQKKNQ